MRTLFLIAVGSAVALAACSSKPPASSGVADTVTDVAVNTATRVTLPDVLEAIGTVRAGETAQVGSQALGTVIAVAVHPGEHVRRGQVLAVVDPAPARIGAERAAAGLRATQSELQAADADLHLAQTTFERYQQLFKEKSVTPQEYDEVRARLAAAQARRETSRAAEAQASATLQQARTALEYTNVRAPFDGVVTARLLDPGTVAAPGTPIVTVEKSGRLRLEVTVDESAAGLIRLGTSVPVLIDADRVKRVGKVVEIAPTADSGSRSIVVKLELAPDSALRSGVFGRAFFSRGTRNGILLPETAVIRRGQLFSVYALSSSSVAELRFITIAHVSNGNVELLSGLTEGERYIAAPGERDWAGKRIGVRQ